MWIKLEIKKFCILKKREIKWKEVLNLEYKDLEFGINEEL